MATTGDTSSCPGGPGDPTRDSLSEPLGGTADTPSSCHRAGLGGLTLSPFSPGGPAAPGAPALPCAGTRWGHQPWGDTRAQPSPCPPPQHLHRVLGARGDQWDLGGQGDLQGEGTQLSPVLGTQKN